MASDEALMSRELYPRELSLEAAEATTLRPGDVVRNLAGSQEMNRLELAAGRQVYQGFSAQDIVRFHEPLSSVFRPKAYHGNWRNGLAVVLPKVLSELSAKMTVCHTPTEEDMVVFLLVADKQSANPSIKGTLARSFTYHLRAPEKRDRGPVGRAPGKQRLLKVPEGEALREEVDKYLAAGVVTVGGLKRIIYGDAE